MANAKNQSKTRKANDLKKKSTVTPKKEPAKKRLDVADEADEVKAGLMAYGDFIPD